MTGVWEPVIGFEVHVQLATEQKMFCPCATRFGDAPNQNVCPVCLGLPGALPVVNPMGIQLAIRTGLALECTVHPVSVFARKNYFYPDLPKGYQITQFDRPLATGGRVAPTGWDPVRIHRIHVEEDAGKSIHDRFPGATVIDLNRTGVPLVEIVSEPDVRSPEQGRAYLQELKQILEYVEVSDCNMEEGSLRVDANVSIRRYGSLVLGTKTEIKNLNSFSAVEKALHYELDRQREVLERGENVEHETLLWDAARQVARPVRTKEESHDYRYFPEPDLPHLVLEPGTVDRIARDLPELPGPRRERLRIEYGLPDYDANVLTADRSRADLFEAVVKRTGDAKDTSNWIMGPVLQVANERGTQVDSLAFGAGDIADLIDLVRCGTVSNAVGRRVLVKMAETGESPSTIVEAEGLTQISDEDALRAWVDSALQEHPDEASRLRSGETKLLGFFVGEVMRRSRGKADPRATSALLRQLIA